MEIAGIIISLFALSLSIFTYFKHDKKIKRQSVLLNKYHLEKIVKEKEEEKKPLLKLMLLLDKKAPEL